MCSCLQAPAASQGTLEPLVKRVSQVDTPTIMYTVYWSYALEKSSSRLLGGNIEVRHHLQALAALLA